MWRALCWVRRRDLRFGRWLVTPLTEEWVLVWRGFRWVSLDEFGVLLLLNSGRKNPNIIKSGVLLEFYHISVP